MASSDDYESLPESMHPAIHMAAGALAGIGEHCVMYPVDVVKVIYFQIKIIFNCLSSNRLGCNVLTLIPMQNIEVYGMQCVK
jgi:hypothetical protein